MKFPIGMLQFQELRTDGWVYGDDALQADFRAALKAFYGTLKSADGDLRFAMLTGVTKFSKVSVFSDIFAQILLGCIIRKHPINVSIR